MPLILSMLAFLAAGSLTLGNLREDHKAGTSAAAAAAALETAAEIQPAEEKTETVQTVSPEMPVQELNGQEYIGTLEIPALERKLGVISRWSGERLQLAPCRYSGSAYTGGLVIAAHNYSAHFGKLKDLEPGDTVLFTDVDGNAFSYEVTLLETLQPEAVEEMNDESWDLTLFTCTTGGASRVTVRCKRMQ